MAVLINQLVSPPSLTVTTLSSSQFNYRTRAIISRSRFEAALVYKPQILSLKKVFCIISRSAA